MCTQLLKFNETAVTYDEMLFWRNNLKNNNLWLRVKYLEFIVWDSFLFLYLRMFFSSLLLLPHSFIHSFIQIADKSYDMYLTICHILWLKVKITLWISHCFLFRGISNKFLRSHLLFLHMSFTFSFFLLLIFIASDYIIIIVTQNLNEWLVFYCEEWCIDIIWFHSNWSIAFIVIMIPLCSIEKWKLLDLTA